MKSLMNVFIIKLKKKIEMYSAFLFYIVGGRIFNSIDTIIILKIVRIFVLTIFLHSDILWSMG